uniref:Uncharacterized protein n=1 Tax=Anopheles culicifacies TaxID=139723 RepID=A0A182M778_9DIPT
MQATVSEGNGQGPNSSSSSTGHNHCSSPKPPPPGSWASLKANVIRWRGSRKLVLVIVAIALLLDNMLLTVVERCITYISQVLGASSRVTDSDHHERKQDAVLMATRNVSMYVSHSAA